MYSATMADGSEKIVPPAGEISVALPSLVFWDAIPALGLCRSRAHHRFVYMSLLHLHLDFSSP